MDMHICKKHKVRLPSEFRELSYQLLTLAYKNQPRADFFRDIMKRIVKFSDLDEVEIRYRDGKNFNQYIYNTKKREKFSFNISTQGYIVSNESLERLYNCIISADSEKYQEYQISPSGSFCCGNMKKIDSQISDDLNSMAIYPLELYGDRIGILLLKSSTYDFFYPEDGEWYGDVARNISISLNYRKIQVMLRERVKELTCLYEIAKLSAQPELSTGEILHRTVKMLPAAWLYPEVAEARIILDDKLYITDGFRQSQDRLSANIFVNNIQRGLIEVAYTEQMPQIDEGPFLYEERNLINVVAQEIGLIIERKEAAEEKEQLVKQLLHADRLATIGQLAAGIAHEINEPLSNILGFTQLAQKSINDPEQLQKDLEKIVDASLYARDVIRKLLTFARQTPSVKKETDINKLVKESIELFRNRLKNESINLTLNLEQGLPGIIADGGQIKQVLVNLIVNAIYAMPDGGDLVISSWVKDKGIFLSVEDTGIGMDEATIKQIFVPFFSTRDVDQGTGLGLAVVHSIVSAHQGKIKVESEPGKGTKFIVKLPINSSS